MEAICPSSITEEAFFVDFDGCNTTLYSTVAVSDKIRGEKLKCVAFFLTVSLLLELAGPIKGNVNKLFLYAIGFIFLNLQT